MFLNFVRSHFLENDNGGAGGGADPSKTVTDPKPADDAAAKAAAKKYTDDDVNNLIAKGKGEAVAALLRELGIPTVEDAKKNLAALKTWQDSQKTESQKAIDDAKAAIDARTAAERRADVAEMKVEAMKVGVDPEKLDDLITLAEKEEGKTIADKVKAAIDKRPWLKAEEKAATFGAAIKHGQPNSKEAATAEVEAAFGLKKAAEKK